MAGHTEGVHHLPNHFVEKSTDEIVLRNRHVLNYSTEVSGQYELASKELFLEMKLLAWYEPVTFDITRRDSTSLVKHTYPPDVFTNMFVGGKQVIIEFHAENDISIARADSFREIYGGRFYYILVSACFYGDSGLVVEVGMNRTHPDAVDELWRLPKIRKARQSYNQADINLWKKYMRTALNEFVEKRADKVESFDKTAALIRVKRE